MEVIVSLVGILITLGVTFAAGSKYGRDAEAKAIALELRFQADANVVVNEYRTVKNQIQSGFLSAFDRLRKYL